MKRPVATQIKKLSQSVQHALRGLGLCIHAERNFRVHLVAAGYVTLFALMGGANVEQGAILCLCFGLTMGAELMNTAIERLCDKQATGYDSLVRNAKDIAAAGVLVCAAACAAVGIGLFLKAGLLDVALRFLCRHFWLFPALLLTAPLALWFIFRYGRTQ